MRLEVVQHLVEVFERWLRVISDVRPNSCRRSRERRSSCPCLSLPTRRWPNLSKGVQLRRRRQTVQETVRLLSTMPGSFVADLARIEYAKSMFLVTVDDRSRRVTAFDARRSVAPQRLLTRAPPTLFCRAFVVDLFRVFDDIVWPNTSAATVSRANCKYFLYPSGIGKLPCRFLRHCSCHTCEDCPVQFRIDDVKESEDEVETRCECSGNFALKEGSASGAMSKQCCHRRVGSSNKGLELGFGLYLHLHVDVNFSCFHRFVQCGEYLVVSECGVVNTRNSTIGDEGSKTD